MQPPKQSTLGPQGPKASFQNEGEMNTYNTQLLEQGFPVSLFEDQGLLMLGNIKAYIMVPNKEFSSSSS